MPDKLLDFKNFPEMNELEWGLHAVEVLSKILKNKNVRTDFRWFFKQNNFAPYNPGIS